MVNSEYFDTESTLYKYRAYSAYALEMIIRCEIYFAKPSDLNDLYDCRIDIDESLTQAIRHAEELKHESCRRYLERIKKVLASSGIPIKIKKDFDELGIFSLAKNVDNVLMWSHYAENHNGFCVGFKLSDKLMTPTSKNDENNLGFSHVRYKNRNPYIDYFKKHFVSVEKAKKRNLISGILPNLDEHWDEFWSSLYRIGMITKAKPWEYEQEIRVLRKYSGLVPFSKSELVEIVFGLNMTKHRRETIQNILSGSEWKHVQFKEVYKSNAFAVSIRDET